MHKEFKLSIFISLAIWLIASYSCFYAYSFTADVVNIDNRDYEAAVIREIDNAKESIDMAIYSLYIKDGGKDFPAYNLMEHLIAAQKRGVDVRLFLDKSPTNSKGNETAYRILTDNGIETYFMQPEPKLHSKLIIIDNKTTIEGSSNWTDNALRKNFENNLLVRSAELAAARRLFFDRLAVNTTVTENNQKGLRIPLEFLKSPDKLAAIVENSDQAVFDIYLWLREQKYTGKLDDIDYLAAARYLGIKVDKRTGNYKRDIRIIVDKLQNKYGLNDFTPPARNYISVPRLFFTTNWAKYLSLCEKAAYFIALNEQNKIWPRRYWRRSLQALENEYHIKTDLLSLAFKGLKRQNLLEIVPSAAGPQEYDTRPPNQYRLKPILSRERIEDKWQQLQKRYGLNIINSSRKLAQMFVKENDPVAVEQLADMIKRYGLEATTNAANTIGAYSDTNPLKNIAHVEAILKNKKIAHN